MYANDEKLSREGAQGAFYEPPTRGEAFEAAFGNGGGQFAEDLTVPYDTIPPRTRDVGFGEARWETTPARRDRPPILRLNRQALDIVNDAIGAASGGATLRAAGGKVYAERIRAHAEELLGRGVVGIETARKMYSLADAFEATADAQRGMIYHLSDRTVPLWRRAQIHREELTHGRQAETAADPEKAAAVRSATMAHPAFDKARAALQKKALYSRMSDETAVREVTAKIAAGLRGQVNLSVGEAADVLRTYYEAVANHFDAETADRVLEYADKEGRQAVDGARRRIQAELLRRRPGDGAPSEGISRIQEGRRGGTEEIPGGTGGGGQTEFSTGQRGLFDAGAERQSQVDSERDADKLLGERLTAQFKSGLAARPTNLKPAENRGLFEEQRPESGNLFSHFFGDERGEQRPPEDWSTEDLKRLVTVGAHEPRARVSVNRRSAALAWLNADHRWLTGFNPRATCRRPRSVHRCSRRIRRKARDRAGRAA